MNKISVIIITKDEEDSISGCLESVKWADEIIIVDSGSQDKTTEIARNYTSGIYIKEWKGFAEQKKYALSLTTNEWVLSVDADEQVSAALKDEIETLDLGSAEGFYLPRENYFINKKITTCGWNSDNQLRLFKKSLTKITDRLVHEGFIVDGRTARLKNPLIHHTFKSISAALYKINYYSSLRAQEIYREKRQISALTIASHSFSAFFRYFISLKGYKDKMFGLLISVFNLITTLLVYSKAWELQKDSGPENHSKNSGTNTLK